MATITAVIPTIPGREELLEKLLASLPKNMQKVIVRDEGMSLAAKRNKGALKAKGRYILFIDDDNVLQPGALDAVLKHWDVQVGIMGLVACYDIDPERVADGGSLRNKSTGFMTGLHTNALVKNLPLMNYDVDEVANAFVIRRQVFRWLRGFDEVNFPIDLDEADLCRRVKAMGFKIEMCPQARCLHKSQTYSWLPDFRRPVNAYMMGRNKILYAKKHKDYLALITSPILVLAYGFALLYRRKPWLFVHFLKGTLDGLFGRKENRYF
jgi:GT2 family glycosyltransferase